MATIGAGATSSIQRRKVNNVVGKLTQNVDKHNKSLDATKKALVAKKMEAKETPENETGEDGETATEEAEEGTNLQAMAASLMEASHILKDFDGDFDTLAEAYRKVCRVKELLDSRLKFDEPGTTTVTMQP